MSCMTVDVVEVDENGGDGGENEGPGGGTRLSRYLAREALDFLSLLTFMSLCLPTCSSDACRKLRERALQFTRA